LKSENKNLDNNNITYNLILTSRDIQKGLQSIDNLKDYFKITNFPQNKIIYQQLDISNENSINNCLQFLKNLKKENKKNFNSEIENNIDFNGDNTNNVEDEGLIDILLNNAGVAYPGNPKINIDIYNKIFSTNVFGTINFTEKIIIENLLKKRSKIIFLSSYLGRINRLGEKLKNEFLSNKISKNDLFEISDRFSDSIINKTYLEEGFGKHIYALSKIIIKKYSEILGNNQNLMDKDIQVYSCCPGWTKTDLGGQNASRTLEEGVVTILYLIELEHKINKNFQGKFFYDSEVSEM